MPKIDTTVKELVDMVGRGELRLPEMQRRYVWPGTRVRDLLDSLYRGYPSGSILVWETEQEAPTRDLAVALTSQCIHDSKTSPRRAAKGHVTVCCHERRASERAAPQETD